MLHVSEIIFYGSTGITWELHNFTSVKYNKCFLECLKLVGVWLDFMPWLTFLRYLFFSHFISFSFLTSHNCLWVTLGYGGLYHVWTLSLIAVNLQLINFTLSPRQDLQFFISRSDKFPRNKKENKKMSSSRILKETFKLELLLRHWSSDKVK